MDIKKKLFSVIILAYNNLEYFERCVNSILAQDYPEIEIILSDDSSKVFQEEKIKKYLYDNKKSNIKNIIINHNDKNLGISKNLNKAIKLSSGEYIKPIAIDDYLYNNKVLTEYSHFFRDNDFDIVASGQKIMKGNEEKYDSFFASKHKKLLKTKNLYSFKYMITNGPVIQAPTVCYRKSFFNKYGYFDERIPLLEDWPMWIKITKLGCKIGYLKSILICYSIDTGISTQKDIDKKKDYYKNKKKCYDLLIFPEKNTLSSYQYRNVKFNYIASCHYNELDIKEKSLFLLKYMDRALIVVLEKIIIRVKIFFWGKV